MNSPQQTVTIEIDGNALTSIEDFVREVCLQHPDFNDDELPDLPTLATLLKQSDEPIDILWRNAAKSKWLMVRKSDVPLDQLPEDGSTMMRDVLLALVWERISLFEKICHALANNPHVKVMAL